MSIHFPNGSYANRYDRSTNLRTSSTADYTIMGWVYAEGLGADQSIFGKSGQPNRWRLGKNSSDKFVFDFFTSVPLLTSSTTVSINTWYHVAITRDVSSAFTLYVNGVQEAQSTSSHAEAGDLWYIGGDGWDAFGWYGQIDSVKEWDGRDLSAGEIVTEMAARAVQSSTSILSAYGWASMTNATVDNTGNGNTLTERGTHTDGANTPYVVPPDTVLTGPFRKSQFLPFINR